MLIELIYLCILVSNCGIWYVAKQQRNCCYHWSGNYTTFQSTRFISGFRAANVVQSVLSVSGFQDHYIYMSLFCHCIVSSSIHGYYLPMLYLYIVLDVIVWSLMNFLPLTLLNTTATTPLFQKLWSGPVWRVEKIHVATTFVLFNYVRHIYKTNHVAMSKPVNRHFKWIIASWILHINW